MSSKHTPGPWAAQTAEPQASPRYDPRRWHVRNRTIGKNAGVCDLSPDAWEDTPAEQVAANARLIAKAPELLECLKRAAEIEKDSIDFDNRGRMSGTGTFPYPEWLETARALIAEIEGGEAV